VSKVVFVERFDVISFTHNLFQFFVDFGRLSERIFGLKIVYDMYDMLFDVGINHLYLFGREFTVLG